MVSECAVIRLVTEVERDHLDEKLALRPSEQSDEAKTCRTAHG